MKCSQRVGPSLAIAAAVLVLAGCNHQPPAKPDFSSTNGLPATGMGWPSNEFTVSPIVVSSLPLQTIASLKPAVQGSGGTRAHARGLVLDEQPGAYIVIHDDTGTIYAQTRQADLPPANETADVEGQPVSDGYSVSLKDASAVESSTGNSSVSGASAGGEPGVLRRPGQLTWLTNVWQIRDLPAIKAAWHYPVRLQAVVTVNTKMSHYFFVQDDSAGITVSAGHIFTNLNPGDVVEIEGVSDPGKFSPIVVASSVTVTGQVPLPEPKPETLFQLASGQDGSQWIEVRGVVHTVSWTNGIADLELSDSSEMLLVEFPADHLPANLLDAVVRIRGACSSMANNRRQFTGFQMWASSLDDVHIEEPGGTDPLNTPAQPIASLGEFHPRQTMQHRVNLAGVVTFSEAGSFFLQDATDGARVFASGAGTLQPGDYVMTAGYPALGEYGYVLRDAVFKVISHREIPPPQPLPPGKYLDPALNNRRVRISARFLNRTQVESDSLFTLQIGNQIFEAAYHGSLPEAFTRLEAGTLLQVTGLYRVLADEARIPRSFQLVIPSAQDIEVLERPSWWTFRHTATVLGVMAAVIGATVLWVVMLRRKVRAQTADLLQSERKFRSLVEQSLVGVYILQDGRFIYTNPRLAAIFGRSQEEMAGVRNLEDLTAPEDLPAVREQLRRPRENEIEFAHYFFRGRRKNGEIIHAEILGSHTELDGKPAELGMLLDVTERKRAQDKIAEQARMLDLASDAIVVCDFEDRILYWNQSAQRIYGWAAPKAVGASAVEKMRVPAADFQNAKNKLLSDRKWRGQFVHRNDQGEEVTVEARWTLVHDSLGKPGSILAINTDITQQKKLEAQFLRAQRLESIGILAGGIAHDLNNIFAPIMMSCHLLELDPDAAERGQLLENILTCTQRAADLVKQILTFARGTDGRRQTVQSRHLLEELRKMLGETLPKSICLEINAAADVWPISADTTQLHQVLMNLCINARDAMPGGGTLAVAAANAQMDDFLADVDGAKPGPYVVLSVTDDGAGMTPEVRERIFDPFFTTKEVGKGTGLGLSTSLGIVKSHGGFIHVYSEPGQGSCFKIYLPAQTSDQDAVQLRVADTVLRRGNNELILLVDDEASVRSIAAQTLKMFGYRVLAASEGTQAVSLYGQHQDEIALVLLDMMMPVLDGPATIHALVQINPNVKIIASSGLVNQSNLAVLNLPAIRGFLPKPYAAQKMLKTIYEVLHSASPTAAD